MPSGIDSAVPYADRPSQRSLSATTHELLNEVDAVADWLSHIGESDATISDVLRRLPAHLTEQPAVALLSGPDDVSRAVAAVDRVYNQLDSVEQGIYDARSALDITADGTSRSVVARQYGITPATVARREAQIAERFAEERILHDVATMLWLAWPAIDVRKLREYGLHDGPGHPVSDASVVLRAAAFIARNDTAMSGVDRHTSVQFITHDSSSDASRSDDGIMLIGDTPTRERFTASAVLDMMFNSDTPPDLCGLTDSLYVDVLHRMDTDWQSLWVGVHPSTRSRFAAQYVSGHSGPLWVGRVPCRPSDPNTETVQVYIWAPQGTRKAEALLRYLEVHPGIDHSAHDLATVVTDITGDVTTVDAIRRYGASTPDIKCTDRNADRWGHVARGAAEPPTEEELMISIVESHGGEVSANLMRAEWLEMTGGRGDPQTFTNYVKATGGRFRWDRDTNMVTLAGDNPPDIDPARSVLLQRITGAHQGCWSLPVTLSDWSATVNFAVLVMFSVASARRVTVLCADGNELVVAVNPNGQVRFNKDNRTVFEQAGITADGRFLLTATPDGAIIEPLPDIDESSPARQLVTYAGLPDTFNPLSDAITAVGVDPASYDDDDLVARVKDREYEFRSAFFELAPWMAT